MRCLVLILSLCASAARACEVALLLAVDVSGSVDHREYAIQMEGLAAALADPVVSEALVVSRAQVMLMQWTGSSRQEITIGWTEVADFATADALAAAVATAPRRWRDYSTAIGEAMALGIAAFDDPGVAACARKVIDISGDGISNEGSEPDQMRDRAARRGITVNALAIEASETGLAAYFRAHVITGPGAFALRAADYRDYPRRIRQKLLREVAEPLAAVR